VFRRAAIVLLLGSLWGCGGSGSAVTTNQDPTPTPTPEFAYVANLNDGTVSMYSVNLNSGILTPTTPAVISS
jgi:hypothetical protein